MKKYSLILMAALTSFTSGVHAAEVVAKAAPASTQLSASGSMLKTVLGLAVVLVVMMLIAWLVKRYMPGVGAQASAVRIVGGVNVGARERVVVLEIAGRWIVVGVGAGQVSSIANLEPSLATDTHIFGPNTELSSQSSSATHQVTPLPAGFDKALPSFAHWLKQSMTKFSEK